MFCSTDLFKKITSIVVYLSVLFLNDSNNLICSSHVASQKTQETEDSKTQRPEHQTTNLDQIGETTWLTCGQRPHGYVWMKDKEGR